jgi:cell division protein FtsW (lipid II flippase)
VTRPSFGDLFLAFIFFAMGIVWIAGARGMPMWERETPGPGWLPFAFGALLVALSIAAALEAWRKPAAQADTPIRKPFFVLGATLAAILALDLIGFVAAIFLMLLVLFALAERKPIIPSLVAAAGVAGALHLIFAVWLAVPLPRGLFGD